MKRNQGQVKRSSLLTIILLSFSSMMAQDRGYFTISIDLLTDLVDAPLPDSASPSHEVETPRFFTAPADDVLTPKGAPVEEIPSYYRHHKPLPENHSGYVIELLQSDYKLERNYPLFERYGNIHYQQLENGRFSYVILADFKRSERVKIFAEKVILPHAPNAQSFRYKRGKRKKM